MNAQNRRKSHIPHGGSHSSVSSQPPSEIVTLSLAGTTSRRNPIGCSGPAAGRSRVGRLRENRHRESDGGERQSGPETGMVLSGTNARLDRTVL